jgi:hypothetical protein
MQDRYDYVVVLQDGAWQLYTMMDENEQLQVEQVGLGQMHPDEM